MIDKALTFIEDELNTAINTDASISEDDVVLGNIAFADPNTSGAASTFDVNNKVVISLVNIEEEKTLKNSSRRVVTGSGIKYQEPAIYLNLYVLFSANHSIYINSLNLVSKVILFFQKKHTFKAIDFPALQAAGIERLIFDIHTLSFEQMNHLWAVLGGKYVPSILYKVRLLQIQGADIIPVQPIIEIEQTSNVIFNNQC